MCEGADVRTCLPQAGVQMCVPDCRQVNVQICLLTHNKRCDIKT